MDGLGAEARQADAIQPARPWRKCERLRDDRGRRGVAARRALRDHARLRHRAAPRCRGGTHRLHGPPTERARDERVARARGARLRDHAAARECVARQRERVTVLGNFRGTPWRGSVHHRGVRRLSGPVRRGDVHWQGDLRRRGVRARHRGSLPREQPAEPRPDRGLVRPRWPRDRRRGVRRLSHALPDGYASPASLDPR